MNLKHIRRLLAESDPFGLRQAFRTYLDQEVDNLPDSETAMLRRDLQEHLNGAFDDLAADFLDLVEVREVTGEQAIDFAQPLSDAYRVLFEEWNVSDPVLQHWADPSTLSQDGRWSSELIEMARMVWAYVHLEEGVLFDDLERVRLRNRVARVLDLDLGPKPAPAPVVRNRAARIPTRAGETTISLENAPTFVRGLLRRIQVSPKFANLPGNGKDPSNKLAYLSKLMDGQKLEAGHRQILIHAFFRKAEKFGWTKNGSEWEYRG